MSFLEFARKRYSVRSYSDRPVEQEKIDNILKAAMIAPTAVNFQPEMIYVLKSREALEKIRSVTRSTYNAPLVFLVCSDSERCWQNEFVPGHDSGEMDATIVGTHMMLEAEAEGLGSVWVLLFDPAKVKTVFALPPNIRPHFLLCVGYPSANARPYAKWHDSFHPMQEIAKEL